MAKCTAPFSGPICEANKRTSSSVVHSGLILTDVSVSVKWYFVHQRLKDSTVDNTARGKDTDTGKKDPKKESILVKNYEVSRCWNVRLASNTHLELSEWSLSHWLALAPDMFPISKNKNGNTLWKSTTYMFVTIHFTAVPPTCLTQQSCLSLVSSL